MQKRTILKYENLIEQYKKDYLRYRSMLRRKMKKHDNCISPFEYKNGIKIIYPVDDYNISDIINFALNIKNYKLALKNLKWYYSYTTPYPKILSQNIQAAFVWFKNNKLDEAENIIQIVFKKEHRYKNIFNNTAIGGTLHDDGSFTYLDSIESQIALQRRVMSNADYADFVEWAKQNFF